MVGPSNPHFRPRQGRKMERFLIRKRMRRAPNGEHIRGMRVLGREGRQLDTRKERRLLQPRGGILEKSCR